MQTALEILVVKLVRYSNVIAGLNSILSVHLKVLVHVHFCLNEILGAVVLRIAQRLYHMVLGMNNLPRAPKFGRQDFLLERASDVC